MDSESTQSPYHEGERRVQERAGVRAAARRVAEMIQPALSETHGRFLAQQPLTVVASTDRTGDVWTSLLADDPGFMRADGADTLVVETRVVPGDRLAEHRREGMPLGVLVIDPRDRSRLCVNGTVTAVSDSRIVVDVEEVYPNCQKYVQRRSLTHAGEPPADAGAVRHSDGLRDDHREWLRTTDTFFVGSHHPDAGADASHRGGDPGFVSVDGNTITFPDYPGNDMFCTLGNLTVTNQAGLLVVDFESGRTLQTTGRARIVWEDSRLQASDLAERLVEVTVTEAVEMPNGNPLRWQLEERSPFNP